MAALCAGGCLDDSLKTNFCNCKWLMVRMKFKMLIERDSIHLNDFVAVSVHGKLWSADHSPKTNDRLRQFRLRRSHLLTHVASFIFVYSYTGAQCDDFVAYITHNQPLLLSMCDSVSFRFNSIKFNDINCNYGDTSAIVDSRFFFV